LKPRFQPDNDPGTPAASSRLIDPEAYDASEAQFAASLEETAAPSPTRFIVEQDASSANLSREGGPDAGEGLLPAEQETPKSENLIQNGPPEPPPDRWREEVAARVNHYRARRRPKAPRYPSLQLRFEGPEASDSSSRSDRPSVAPAVNRLALATDDQDELAAFDSRSETSSSRAFESEGGAKILEFPRSSAMPPFVLDELAEPVFSQPRILEVPAVVPPPPALGGILIEADEESAAERRPGFELPLRAAPLSRRILAGAIDAVLVILALALFAYGFFRITAAVPPWRLAATAATSLMAVFWAGYQYLLLVHAGSTPGLKLAKLELSRFDGSPVPQRLRRWRVLASVLSGLSLALGYAWCFLDEDELCWHDRITRTYMAPKGSK
jgi:uncharacterized RDD family membrane protein YckC